MTLCGHLRILTYKNIIVKIRRYLSTILEILFPLQIIFILFLFSFILPSPYVGGFPEVRNTCSACKPVAITPELSANSHSLRRQFAKSEILKDRSAWMMRKKEFEANIEFLKYRDTYQAWSFTYEMDRSMNQSKEFVENGHLHMISQIHRSIGRMNGIDYNISIATKQFPSKPGGLILDLTVYIFPIYFAMSILGVFQTHLLSLVGEKARIRPTLEMIGTNMISYEIAHFLVSFLQSSLTCVLTVCVLYLTKMLVYTHWTMFLYLYLCYFLNILVLAQFASRFFSDVKVAGIVCNLILFSTIGGWLMARIFVFSWNEVPRWVHIFVNFISPVTFSEFMYQVSIMEKAKTPLSWMNLNDTRDWNMLYGIIQLSLNWIVYVVLYLILLLRPWSWKWKKSTNYDRLVDSDSEGIHLVNITKHFTKWCGTPTIAVDDLSLTLNEGEITCLLGKNGAGKTTLIGMLTGTLEATYGDIKMNGSSILDDMTELRKMLGVCPQDSIVFEKLTAREHLWLFGSLKGIASQQLQTVIDGLLHDVGLDGDIPSQVGDFSGGMKRKLAVAMALIGDPKIIVLDEPTSSLDPQSRRMIWKLLQERKRGRYIVLTTHSMEEADLLGDSIAIVRKGKLQAAGTSLYLKNHYGVGYSLVCVTGNTFDSIKTLEFITSRISNVKQKQHRGREQTYVLPYSSMPLFPSFLQDLESSEEELGIESFGLNVTTLEEIFLSLDFESVSE